MIFFIALKTCMQERVDAGENELGSPSPLPSVFKALLAKLDRTSQ